KTNEGRPDKDLKVIATIESECSNRRYWLARHGSAATGSGTSTTDSLLTHSHGESDVPGCRSGRACDLCADCRIDRRVIQERSIAICQRSFSPERSRLRNLDRGPGALTWRSTR